MRFLFVLLFPFSLFGFVTCDFRGRLGNQLFQIAATMSLAKELRTDPCFHLKTKNPDYQEDLERNYNRVFPKIPVTKIKPGGINVFKEKDYHYEKISSENPMRLDGYFQSEKYFKKHKAKILPYFLPNRTTVKRLTDEHPWLLENKSVSVHLRCYFYEGPYEAEKWGVLSKDYFLKAMALFPEDSLFVFFSDDIEFCKEIFEGDVKNALFIEGKDPIDDFYLMSLCQHNIISNSTFSWWSAYLNQNPDKKIVAPALWSEGLFDQSNEIIPEEWIKIDFDYENPIRPCSPIPLNEVF